MPRTILPILYPDDCVGYWPLVNGEAVDFSGNGNDGTLSGGPTVAVGPNGSECLEFDGTDQLIEFAGDPGAANSHPFTYCAWVYIDTISDGTIITEYNTGNTNYARMRVVNNLGDFIGYQTAGALPVSLKGATLLNTAQWYFFGVVSAASDDHEVFVNGVSDGTNTTDTGTITVDDARFGSQGDGSEDFDGRVAHAFMYSRALTGDDMKRIMSMTYQSLPPIVT